MARAEIASLRQQLSQEKSAAQESERLMKMQNDTLRAELTARDKKAVAEADVTYLKNIMMKFLQAEQKEVRTSSSCLRCVECVSVLGLTR